VKIYLLKVNLGSIWEEIKKGGFDNTIYLSKITPWYYEIFSGALPNPDLTCKL